MQLINSNQLATLRVQLIQQHQEDLAALDRLIGRLQPAALPPAAAPVQLAAPLGRRLHVDKVIERHKTKRAKQVAPATPSNGKRPFGWFQQALKEYIADQIQPFTSEQVRAHLS